MQLYTKEILSVGSTVFSYYPTSRMVNGNIIVPCISSPLLNLFLFVLLFSFFASEARFRTSELYKRVDLVFIFIFYSDDGY